MLSLLWDKVNDLLPPAAGDWLPFVVLALAGLVVLWIFRRMLRRRKYVEAPLPKDLTVEVATLTDAAPPPGPPLLEFYNLPVRVAAVVLAPVGRMRDLPSDDQLPALLDAIVPGLDKVTALHQPLVRRWPNQVSARGFAHLFFNNAQLPGSAGKGTPWSSAAGIFKLNNQPVMAGLVLRADAPTVLARRLSIRSTNGSAVSACGGRAFRAFRPESCRRPMNPTGCNGWAFPGGADFLNDALFVNVPPSTSC